MLGSLILYLKGMRIMMFQLSGFYYSLVMLGVTLESLRPSLGAKLRAEAKPACGVYFGKDSAFFRSNPSTTKEHC